VEERTAVDILIAGPNLSLDRTIAVDEVSIGRIHRAGRRDARGGGKGANVARALRSVGKHARVAGFVAGPTGAAIRALLAGEGLHASTIEVEGESRSCLTVLARDSITVFNEEGPAIDRLGWGRFEDLILANVPERGILVCSGSWPPGAPVDAVARLVRGARERSCFSICDTSRAQLRGALDARPDLVKPNLAEARSILDPDAPPEPADERAGALDLATEFATRLLDLGPQAVVCSAGSQGAVLATRDGRWRFPAIPIEAVNPVGAGDSMVAGIADAIARNEDLVTAVHWGTAMAAASCETFPAGLLDGDRARGLLAGYEESNSAI
jgi:1-phosphofructokinase family hexose kinase